MERLRITNRVTYWVKKGWLARAFGRALGQLFMPYSRLKCIFLKLKHTDMFRAIGKKLERSDEDYGLTAR
jgi:hypothetical protein